MRAEHFCRQFGFGVTLHERLLHRGGNVLVEHKLAVVAAGAADGGTEGWMEGAVGGLEAARCPWPAAVVDIGVLFRLGGRFN